MQTGEVKTPPSESEVLTFGITGAVEAGRLINQPRKATFKIS